MYICDICSKVSNSGEPANSVVTKKRQKTYTNGSQISYGWEIVKEVQVCTNCFEVQRP